MSAQGIPHDDPVSEIVISVFLLLYHFFFPFYKKFKESRLCRNPGEPIRHGKRLLQAAGMPLFPSCPPQADKRNNRAEYRPEGAFPSDGLPAHFWDTYWYRKLNQRSKSASRESLPEGFVVPIIAAS
jgi:hypothetical protein